MTILLTDNDLKTVLPMSAAIEAVEQTLRERVNGTGVAIARTSFNVGEASLIFTPGGLAETGIAGVRIYCRGADLDQQLVTIWDTHTGELLCLIPGAALGPIRTGAIGAVAVKYLAPPDTQIVGVIGGGVQTRTQLLAIQQVRPIQKVLLFRRDPVQRQQVTEALQAELGIPVEAVTSAQEAVASADLVVIATKSNTPVIQADWLKPGVHINALGPKYHGRSEIGLDLIEAADVLASDFPEQYERESNFILYSTEKMERIRDLAHITNIKPTRPQQFTTLFLSHGLAGTEVAVANAAYLKAKALGIGLNITV
jgi:ornithine cyclodeaminase/alanine dehydrogenase-like protein (mu-crystallin family)